MRLNDSQVLASLQFDVNVVFSTHAVIFNQLFTFVLFNYFIPSYDFNDEYKFVKFERFPVEIGKKVSISKY